MLILQLLFAALVVAGLMLASYETGKEIGRMAADEEDEEPYLLGGDEDSPD